MLLIPVFAGCQVIEIFEKLGTFVGVKFTAVVPLLNAKVPKFPVAFLSVSSILT